MSIERSIISKLYESRNLTEAEFSVGGSTYRCVFGKYYKDGEEITRDDYFKAKGDDSAASPSPTSPKKTKLSAEVIDKYADPWEEKSGDEVLDNSYSKFREKKAEYYIAKEKSDKALKSLRNRVRKELGGNPSSAEFVKAYDRARMTDPEYKKQEKSTESARRKWQKSGIQFKKDYIDARARGINIPRDYYGDATEFDDYD